MGIPRFGVSVFAVAVLVSVVCAGTAFAGGMGGYNPGDEVYPSGTTPLATKLVKPTASVSPVASSAAVVATDSLGAGALLSSDSAPCANTGRAAWWVTVAVVAAVLLWLGRVKGTYLWLIALYAVLWFAWAWKLCDFGFSWLPVLLAVIIWLISVPRPGAAESK